ncbi:MAG: flagellar biosynthesis protein FlgK [Lachnospiraceae bacterium]|nr:flagellar biosynthesis protein FlgK [Lachnospiraceae bacterium]
MLRATFAGFSTAYSALQANQKRLDITGQNLANMNTPGYTRQTLKTSSLNYTHPVSHYMNGAETVVGFGVHMDTVAQIRDPFLDSQYRDQIRKSGYTDGIQTALDRLADIFDETQINGIRDAFDNIQTSLLNMQDPSKVNDPICESELRARMQALTNLLNDASRQLDKAEEAEFSRLDGTGTSENGMVQEVNDILQQIGNLNRLIKNDQIFGQPALELMDQRNQLLDELASYIPIEVTYYKDAEHDGLDAAGNTVLSENYHLDANGDPFAKKDWPDDLRVEMVYTNDKGEIKRLTLVEGTVGTGSDNYGQLEISFSADANGNPVERPFDASKAGNIELTFNSSSYFENGKVNDALTPSRSETFTKATWGTKSPYPDDSGSIQSSLDMLWKDGKTANMTDVKGYEFYRNQLDTLARTFADVVNTININGTSTDPTSKDDTQFLITDRTGTPITNWTGSASQITAANIGINANWSSGTVHVSKAGESSNETVLDLYQAMTTAFKGNPATINGKPMNFTYADLEGNTFADYMNHTSTILANDSFSNQQALKTNITVLNGIQNSRDSISGVSLDEEAANMMVYMSAYNAASRLMTTLDEALERLITSTGMVGR